MDCYGSRWRGSGADVRISLQTWSATEEFIKLACPLRSFAGFDIEREESAQTSVPGQAARASFSAPSLAVVVAHLASMLPALALRFSDLDRQPQLLPAQIVFSAVNQRKDRVCVMRDRPCHSTLHLHLGLSRLAAGVIPARAHSPISSTNVQCKSPINNHRLEPCSSKQGLPLNLSVPGS
jgi:hypothetical protein